MAATINPKAATNEQVFRIELIKAICGLGSGVGGTTTIDYSALTPAEITDLTTSVINAGGIVETDAFGVPFGVLMPLP